MQHVDACFCWNSMEDIDSVLETYELMSKRYLRMQHLPCIQVSSKCLLAFFGYARQY